VNSKAVTTVGGQNLLSTLRRGNAATFHLSYKVVGDVSAIGGALTLDVWQSPPQAREDTVLVHDGQTTRTESFTTANGGHLCTQSASGAWSCQVVPTSQSSASGAAGILSSISAQVTGHGVAMAKQTIGGYAVTCYTVQTTDAPKLCATAQGIPVLISDSDVSYQLVSLSNKVNAAVFTLPAG
jgi:hypothetical protein